MEEILKKYPLLKDKNVPRETLLDFESFIDMIQTRNLEINIISKETAKNEVIRQRHIVDSAQIIDFIDLNSSIITDIGTGGGMPGIIISIMIKNLKKSIMMNLYEKSHHKSSFLRKVSRELKLNTEIIQKDIFDTQNLESGTIMARAFKPLPIVIELVYKNFSNYKNLILFMGKNGEKILEDTLKIWDFDFEKKKSITSENSFLLNIKNIKKKTKN
jgi:16S rRNA (guanine527-N7)-methyltransferase